jgi:hypothetical protein
LLIAHSIEQGTVFHVQLTRKDRCDNLEIDVRLVFADLLNDLRAVLHEVVVQGEDEFLIQLVAIANRRPAGLPD